MTVYIACRNWLGVAAALRLREVRPELDIGLAPPTSVAHSILSAKAASWLAARDPRIAACLETSSMAIDGLVIGRGVERQDCHGPGLVALGRRHWAELQDDLIARAKISIRAPIAGELIVGHGARRRFAHCQAMAEGGDQLARIQFAAMPSKTRAQLRVFPSPQQGRNLQLLWPAQSALPDHDDIASLLEFAVIGDRAALEALIQGMASRQPIEAHAVDYDLGNEADALVWGESEAAIALVEALAGVVVQQGELAAIRTQSLAARESIVAGGQHATRNLLDWHANPQRYAGLPISQFAYSLLTATQRLGHEQLRATDPDLVAAVETGIAKRAGLDRPVAPMFTPFRLRALTLANRVVVSPMCMYSAREGMPNDFHLVHLGARALGGAGLVLTEMTDVSPEGRISPGCAGLYDDAHIAAWKRIVDFVHSSSAARIGLQLGHAGPKASTQLGWQRMDEPLAEGNWPILAASAQPCGPRNQAPKAMDEADMDLVERQFAQATERAIACGFDMIELHFAHGYLLSSFISPLTNLRADRYGGSLANRLRFPLRVFNAVRKLWPQERPISVRLSASDWAPGGVDVDQAVDIARAFQHAGADAITVSTGQTTRLAKPDYGRMYQLPFADRIRQEAGIATIAVGAITEADQVNGIIGAGRADLCALARPHLVDAAWTLRAAVAQRHGEQRWPKQYLAGKAQADRETGRPKLQGAA